MDDETALVLCAFEEAVGEIDDGVAAVVRVVLNRVARRYESDGTIQGTIFAPNQFSWTGWQMVAGRYVKVAHNPEQIAARAAQLRLQAERRGRAWARVSVITASVRAGTWRGPAYDRLTDDTVLYLNPTLVHATWATPSNEVCVIGRHTFYRA